MRERQKYVEEYKQQARIYFRQKRHESQRCKEKLSYARCPQQRKVFSI